MAEPNKNNLNNNKNRPGDAGAGGVLPQAHKPTVPLPGKAPVISEPPVEKPKVGEGAPPKPVSQKQPAPKELSTEEKLKEVKLPESGSPEIFLQESEAVETANPELKPLVEKKEAVSDIEGVQPVLEAGGAKKFPVKKVFKLIVVLFGIAVLLGGLVVGYQYIRETEISLEEPIAPPVIVFEETVEEKRKRDLVGLDGLNDSFKGFGGLLEILETDASFKESITTRQDFY